MMTVPAAGCRATATQRAARAGLVVAALFAACPVKAQFARAPEPQRATAPAASMATSARDYRLDAARHLYAYPSHVLVGMVPPLVYAIVVTETEVDAQGRVLGVRIVRAPAAAKEVTPWVVTLIRKASPWPPPPPPPPRVGRVRVLETWLVDESGRFQVHILTEGQR
jgi:periplasmic protein TonB